MKTCLIALRNLVKKDHYYYYYYTTIYYLTILQLLHIIHIIENQCTATKIQTKYNKHAKKILLIMMITRPRSTLDSSSSAFWIETDQTLFDDEKR